MSAQLPDKGWTGYGRPTHPYMQPVRVPRVAGNRCGVSVIEMHAAVAEIWLERHGVQPALVAYLAGIGRAHQ